MELADRLRAARTAKGLSQTDLAEKSDVSLRNISLIEHRHRLDLKFSTAEKLATALQCSAEWLIYGKGIAPEGVKPEPTEGEEETAPTDPAPAHSEPAKAAGH